VSKRKQTSRTGATSRRKASTRRGQARRGAAPQGEPDLIDQIAATLDDDDPLPLLGLASTLLAALDTRSRNPFAPTSDGPTREDLVESFLAIPMPETSALLTAVAALSGDEVLMRRVSREVARRAHPLPAWLTGMPSATAAPDAFEVTHVLGDGDNVIVTVRLPGGHALTAVVYIDHNLGTLVKDAFVVSDPASDVVGRIHAASSDEPDTVVAELATTEAKARIRQAIELGAMTYPPLETDTWPSCRSLVEWMNALLPDGGVGYERPDWDDKAVADLARRFRASPFAAQLDDPDDLLSSLLWFGTDYGPGDPLRWSPVAVEILLLDWIPRKIVADADSLASAPDLLRAFVRFCHHERGIRAALTDETLDAIDAFAPEYQRIIRSDRPQGPEALMAAMGMFRDDDPDDDPLREAAGIMLESLRDAVGGDAALDRLDADPLPDEPFAWDSVAPDVHDRVEEVLALVERCCAQLLDQQYRTVCRRLLADAAAGDPDIFRRRGRVETAAGAICWIASKANSLFDPTSGGPTLMVKQLAEHFGLTGTALSQRSVPLVRAIGADPYEPGRVNLGTPRYLTGPRRAAILADRDRYRAMAD
jgi:Domain of unknown function (DUF6398)